MTNCHVLLGCLSSLAFLIHSHSAAAQVRPPEMPPEAAPTERHHRGFYMRSHIGGGYRTASATANGDELSISGAGASFGVAAGGAVAKDVIVYGELFADEASSPTVSGSFGSAKAHDMKMSFIALGPGVTYYIMPANVHLGVSALLTKLSLGGDSGGGQTEWGFGGAARIGKDFWLGNAWGLGVMGQVTMANMKDSTATRGDAPHWNSTTATLALEFTYH